MAYSNMEQFEEVLEKYVVTKPLNVLIRAYSSYSKQQIYTLIYPKSIALL